MYMQVFIFRYNYLFITLPLILFTFLGPPVMNLIIPFPPSLSPSNSVSCDNNKTYFCEYVYFIKEKVYLSLFNVEWKLIFLYYCRI